MRAIESLVIACALTLLGCSARDETPAHREAKPLPPMIVVALPEHDPASIYLRVEAGMTNHCDGDEACIVAAVWDDGLVVWSEDIVRGGSPYRFVQVDRDVVSHLVANVSAIAGSCSNGRFMFDAPYSAFVMRTPNGLVRLSGMLQEDDSFSACWVRIRDAVVAVATDRHAEPAESRVIAMRPGDWGKTR